MDTSTKIEKRREEARKRQQEIKKRENAKISQKTKHAILSVCITVLSILVILALIFPNTGLSRRMLTAVTIGDTKVSVAEYSYYYRSSFNNYYQTIQNYFGGNYMPIDLTKSLEKQAYSEDQTYADYFSNQAISSLKEVIVLAEEAQKAGFELPADSQQALEESLASVKTSAEASGVSVNNYLSTNFGMGFNMTLLEKCVRRELLADAYKSFKEGSFEYTEDELDAFYNDHHIDYDVADIRMVTFTSSEATEDAEAVTIEEARAKAEAFAEGITSEEDFAARALEKAQEQDPGAEDTSLITNLRFSSLTSADQNVANWVFYLNHKAGDCEVVDGADGTTVYVLYMIAAPHRQTENTVDIRHILIAPEDAESEESKAEAKAKAEEIYQQFLDGGASEDLFAQLATENSTDTGSASNGGLYTGVYPGQMVQSFNDWCFDEARFAGDSGIIESEYGYHIMYFVGENEARWIIDARADKQAEDYTSWYSEVADIYPVTNHEFAMRYRSEPI
ncbi:MAG: peptidylprolyl isomerase [Firmicutes bacterium]|nr:peptidylprolyl isomerase [Bacillota bacterium]